MNQLIEERNRRVEWYLDSRFGMFIHWGLYAVPARGEWVQSLEKIPKEQYENYMKEFHISNYNPKVWAKTAKQAGMKYAVLTAKHHDGFCLFDTAYTDFKSTNAPCQRDIVREFLQAFREEGIKVGLYYSLLDWHHPDYPHYGDRHHPMRDNEAYKGKAQKFERYQEYMHNQIKELLTNYGKLDLMWFDFSYDEMSSEAWKAAELIKEVRKLQPDIIIDNRLEGSGEYSGTILTKYPKEYAGDFASPEQMIPPNGIFDEEGDPIPWEACVTLNNNWGYHAHDKHYKSSKLVIRTLVECVSKNGNLILNVSPDATGKIPKETLAVLWDVGEWISENGESIYGCGASAYPKPEWGRFTQKGKKLYAHILEEQVGAICLKGMSNAIDTLRLLKDKSEICETDYWNVKEYGQDFFFFLDKEAIDCYPLPDERDTVVEIMLKDEKRGD